MPDVKIITVVRDAEMYRRCIVDNMFVMRFEHVPLLNTEENMPIPMRYNAFLDSCTDDEDARLVFCHEDFEFLEDISGKLKNLDKGCLYGANGSARVGLFGFGVQRVYGEITEASKDGKGLSRKVGIRIRAKKEVETFDCCCIIMHSSLVRRFDMRFDEKLEFDLYVEDFCADARLRFGVKSYVIQMEACHHSGSIATERLWRHLPYLAAKYPDNAFVGSLTYFGTPDWRKRIQDWIAHVILKRPK